METTGRSRRFEINLDQSRTPRAYRDSHNLWPDELNRIYDLLGRQVELVEDQERERRQKEDAEGCVCTPADLPHLAIAIFGPSGSGKSSLIRTLADDVRRRDAKGILPERLCGMIATLPLMNPTTWSPSDQFLYAFLAAALEEERREQQRREHSFPQGLSPVQLAFQEVNEYLRVVDDVDHAEEHDPLGLSLQKLERHTSGLRLRRSLGDLIERLAEVFHAQVVLLPVDDLDMAPDHLVSALQSYQSYLTHPRLVPVFTFTDRMSEELIEVHYKAQLGDMASQSRLMGSNRLGISEQIAVQFLARCFPVRNRIRLGPAPARVQRAVFSTGFSRGEARGPGATLVQELLIQSSFLLFGHPDREDAHQIRAALRPSTLRRQLQVVDAMSDVRVWALRTPQFGVMAGLAEDGLPEIVKAPGSDERLLPGGGETKSAKVSEAEWKKWREDETKRRHLSDVWSDDKMKLRGEAYEPGYRALAWQLRELNRGATWATIFNGATWSLLNVHRDTLRELGLFLEDLYSWTPKELRGVVLDNLLAQDQSVRRTVVDRWFNRTDFRRSQVLSLLAANAFRPWMEGEEPYGDEEVPIRAQIDLEKAQDSQAERPLDRDWRGGDAQNVRQIRTRLTIPAPSGLLWFLNLTLGFYLPQVMVRNWDQALSGEVPVRSRMSGNGWNLHHAATNAMRIADAKQEMASFGMLFLDPTGYRSVLEIPGKKWPKNVDPARDLAQSGDWSKIHEERGTDAPDVATMWRRHLLLRIWTCCGFGKGRFWAGFSLWRGLSFIGQILEVGSRHGRFLESGDLGAAARAELESDLFRLVHRHGLQGLVPGSLLNKNSNDDLLLLAFAKWEPQKPFEREAIGSLVSALVDWLACCWNDRIYPLPAGDIWLSWKNCFIRRIHGEYLLGGLWPRINAAYLEDYERAPEWRELAAHRSLGPAELEARKEAKKAQEYRWLASTAAGAWSDLIFEYWRGCPPILKLLLTCPVMLRSNDRFAELGRGEEEAKAALEESGGWLERLGLHAKTWQEVRDFWAGHPHGLCLVPSELAIERAQPETFEFPPPRRAPKVQAQVP